jgi:hypothetical protein
MTVMVKLYVYNMQINLGHEKKNLKMPQFTYQYIHL